VRRIGDEEHELLRAIVVGSNPHVVAHEGDDVALDEPTVMGPCVNEAIAAMGSDVDVPRGRGVLDPLADPFLARAAKVQGHGIARVTRWASPAAAGGERGHGHEDGDADAHCIEGHSSSRLAPRVVSTIVGRKAELREQGGGNFTCTNSLCAAKPCTKDSDCANFCVTGSCSAVIGSGAQAVP